MSGLQPAFARLLLAKISLLFFFDPPPSPVIGKHMNQTASYQMAFPGHSELPELVMASSSLQVQNPATLQALLRLLFLLPDHQTQNSYSHHKFTVTQLLQLKATHGHMQMHIPPSAKGL